MLFLVFVNHVSLFHFLNGYNFICLLMSANTNFAKSSAADNLQRLIVVYRNLRSSNVNVNRGIEYELTIVDIFLLLCAEFPTLSALSPKQTNSCGPFTLSVCPRPPSFLSRHFSIARISLLYKI